MNEEICILICVISSLISIIAIVTSYYIGFLNGFKKCKEIDDEILTEQVLKRRNDKW